MPDESETTTGSQETQTATPPAPAITAADVRNHELFQKLTEKVKASDDALAQLKADQAKAEEDRKLAELEKAQNWDALKAELAAKHEREMAEREAELIAERLTNKLVLAGVTHSFAILAAKQQYKPGDKSIDDFVAEFVASDEVKALIANPAPPAALPGGDAGGGSQRSTDNDWAQIKADKASGDSKKMMAAARAVREYMDANNGERPPGF